MPQEEWRAQDREVEVTCDGRSRRTACYAPRMKLALAIVAAALLLVGCAGKTTSASTASPSSSPSPVFTVPTKLFQQRRPGRLAPRSASWHAGIAHARRCASEGPEGQRTGDGADDLEGPSGSAEVTVVFTRARQARCALRLRRRQRQRPCVATLAHRLHRPLVTPDGPCWRSLSDRISSEAPTGRGRYFVQLSSGDAGDDLATLQHSLLYLSVVCRAGLWPTQRATLLTILDDLRLSRPKG